MREGGEPVPNWAGTGRAWGTSSKLLRVPLPPVRNLGFERREAIAAGARLRALVVFASIACGFLISAKAVPEVHPGFFPGLACLSIAGALLAGKRWFLVFLALGIVFLSSSYYQLRVQREGSTSLGPRIEAMAANSPARAAIVRVRGVIETNFRLAPRQGPPLGQFLHQIPAARSILKVEEIEEGGGWERVEGKLWVRIELVPGSLDAAAVPAQAGDSVEVVGLARGVGRATNPGDFDATDWAVDHGFAGSLSLSGPALLTTIAVSESAWRKTQRNWTGFKEGLATRARAGMERATAGFAETERTLVLALVLGDTPTDESLNQAFMRLGLAHVLAISGFHLVVMVQMFLVMMRLTGDRGRIETLIAIVLVVAYMMIVPAQAPIVRSGWTCLALLFAEWLGRRYDTVTVLIWISSALIIVHPTDLWSLGYQLSCGLTVLLIWLGQHARNTIFLPRIRGVVKPLLPAAFSSAQWLLEHVKALVATTLLCALAAVPWIAARTGTVSPLVVLATVVIVPPITMLLWIAFLTLMVGIVAPPLVDVLAPILRIASEGIVWLLTLVDSLPMTHFRVVRPDVLWAMCATGVVIAWFVRRRKRERLMWAATGAVAAWWAVTIGVHSWRESERTLRIDMLDVGDGSCLVVRSGGETMLWDAGSLRRGMGSDTIIHALTEMNVTRLDSVYVTHPDIDHFGGLPAIITAFKVKDVYTCDRFLSQAAKQPDGAAATLVRLAERTGCRFHAAHEGDVKAFGSVTLNVLSPPAPE